MRLGSPRQFCINVWNVAGALHSLYSIQRNSNTPMFLTVKAVYCWDISDIFTCQNLLFRSMQEKCQEPTMDSMVSCIWGSGYDFFPDLLEDGPSSEGNGSNARALWPGMIHAGMFPTLEATSCSFLPSASAQ